MASRNTSPTASSCSTTGSGPDHDAAAARREVPRLGPRHQRVPVPDRRRGHQRAADHLGRARATRTRPRASRPGVAGLDAMLGAGGYYRGSSVLVSGRPGTGKTASPRISPTPPAGAASAASISPSRNRPSRSCATCAPPASTWSATSRPGCCASRPRGRACTASRCTWPACTAIIETVRARRRGGRPDLGLPRRSQSEIHATLLRLVDLCKARGITGAVHQPLLSGRSHREDESEACLADGHLDLADRHRGRTASATVASTC